MSSQSALALQYSEAPKPVSQPPSDLCERIYLRNYEAHQALQQSISADWCALLT